MNTDIGHATAKQEGLHKMTEFFPLLLTLICGVVMGVVAVRFFSSDKSITPRGEDAAAPLAPHGEIANSPDKIETAPAGPKLVLSRFTKKQMILGATGLLALGATGVFAFGPDTTAATATGTMPAAALPNANAANLDDVDTMIQKLADRLKTDTEDGEGFRMLGWSYQNTNRPAEAVAAYKRAVELLPDRADVRAGYGEALVSLANGQVTPNALAEFQKAIALDPNQPRARYFLALAKEQSGQEKAALEDYIALANSAPASEAWQIDVRKQAAALAKKLGVDLDSRLKEQSAAPVAAAISGGPTPAQMTAASALPQADQAQMIDGMVEGLAAKLQANPDDVDGWGKLIRSRVVMGQAGKAKDDLAMARKQFAGQPDKLANINALASELGL